MKELFLAVCFMSHPSDLEEEKNTLKRKWEAGHGPEEGDFCDQIANKKEDSATEDCHAEIMV